MRSFLKKHALKLALATVALAVGLFYLAPAIGGGRTPVVLFDDIANGYNAGTYVESGGGEAVAAAPDAPADTGSGGSASVGNPGNNKDVGNAGENPNGSGDWGSGSKGMSDGSKGGNKNQNQEQNQNQNQGDTTQNQEQENEANSSTNNSGKKK